MKKKAAMIKRELAKLREQVEQNDDPVLSKVSYIMECAIRWAVEDTVGWDSPSKDARKFTEDLRRMDRILAP
jgi:hypothetical protein